jgi:DNA repair exonuclease SbcCD ATPase subunit
MPTTETITEITEQPADESTTVVVGTPAVESAGDTAITEAVIEQAKEQGRTEAEMGILAATVAEVVNKLDLVNGVLEWMRNDIRELRERINELENAEQAEAETITEAVEEAEQEKADTTEAVAEAVAEVEETKSKGGRVWL